MSWPKPVSFWLTSCSGKIGREGTEGPELADFWLVIKGFVSRFLSIMNMSWAGILFVF